MKTNLEWLKENLTIKEKEKVQLCAVVNEKICKSTCTGKNCYDCPLNEVDDLIDLLLKEHNECVKLKRWEYDLLNIIEEYCDLGSCKFMNTICYHLKDIGYFKDVQDVNKTVNQILKNCEVIEK